MFLLKYPMQSLASVADQIAKKDGEVAPAKEESAPAPVVEKVEPTGEIPMENAEGSGIGTEAPVAEVTETSPEVVAEEVAPAKEESAPVAEETAPEATDAAESTPTE